MAAGIVTWPFDVIRMLSPSERRSPAKPATIQERLLLRRRAPAKHGVAVRKPAEPADDIEVKLGVFKDALVSRSPAQVAAALLVRERFRVHVGEIEERPLRLGGLP